jgi:hypothetical protein
MRTKNTAFRRDTLAAKRWLRGRRVQAGLYSYGRGVLVCYFVIAVGLQVVYEKLRVKAANTAIRKLNDHAVALMVGI